METLIEKIDLQNIDEEIIQKFGSMLKDGKTVIFPTETVYGLGANALSEEASSKIYKAKGRPNDNPLLVHISEVEELFDLVEDIGDREKLLIDRFWPGPLTIVFKKKDIIPDVTSGGLDTVAIRMPSNEIARRLIKSSGVPIAAPSANISGRPSPTREEHIVKDMDGRVDGILLGGDSDFGLESTIVDLSGDSPLVLRPGSITLEMLKEVLGNIELDSSLLKKDDNIKAKAPGMKYKHYSPDAKIYIVSGDEDRVEKRINELVVNSESENKKAAVICLEKNTSKYKGRVFSLGSTYEDAAKNLFDVLISLDREGIDVAYSESFEDVGVGVAIMNRLKKSAGYDIIEV